jgi:hypothetical protein
MKKSKLKFEHCRYTLWVFVAEYWVNAHCWNSNFMNCKSRMFTSVVQVSQMAPNPDQLSGWFFHLTTVTMLGKLVHGCRCPSRNWVQLSQALYKHSHIVGMHIISDCSKPQSTVHTYKGSVNQSVAKKLMPSETT